jgi:hypothetical protein
LQAPGTPFPQSFVTRSQHTETAPQQDRGTTALSWPERPAPAVAADSFTTAVWNTRGLVTYYTAFLIERQSRRVRSRGPCVVPSENSHALPS